MSSLLSTERKYNRKYYHYYAQALLLFIVMVFFLIKTLLSWTSNIHPFAWTISLLLFCVFFRVYLPYLNKSVEENDNSWGTGYMIEELVGTKLAALGDNYRVIHDVSKGKSRENIDHIVIGPTGIFVIESKANRNAMVYYKNNQRIISDLGNKFMNQVARNSCWVRENISDLLKNNEFVHGIIVRPLNADKKIEMYCSNRVCVMDGDVVYDHIKNFNSKLSKQEISEIYHRLCELKRTNEMANKNKMQKKLALFL